MEGVLVGNNTQGPAHENGKSHRPASKVGSDPLVGVVHVASRKGSNSGKADGSRKHDDGSL